MQKAEKRTEGAGNEIFSRSVKKPGEYHSDSPITMEI